MSINLRLTCLGMLIAFISSGCQSPYNKWATASKERANAKSKVQGNSEELATRSSNDTREIHRLTRQPQVSELIEKGDQFRKKGQYDDARLAYNSALQQSPENPDVNHRLAIIADKRQQFSVADRHYQAALLAKPKDVNLLSDLGYSYSLRGNTGQAEKTLKQALAINPAHRGAMANLGAIYAKQNRYPEALAMFRMGSATETEARQNVAKLFPNAAAEQLAMSDGEAKVANNKNGVAASASDLRTASVEQLQEELSRRVQSEPPGRQRESSWDQSDDETDKFEPQVTRQRKSIPSDSDRDGSNEIARSDMPRGQSASQILQVRGQTNGDRVDITPPSRSSREVIAMATRVGMNAGPGNLFPILPLNVNSDSVNSVNEDVPDWAKSASADSRSNNGASPPTNISTSQYSPNSTVIPGGPVEKTAKATFTDDVVETFDAAPPTNRPLTTRTVNWRDNLQNSISWDSETQDASSTSSGLDWGGKANSGPPPSLNKRNDSPGKIRSETGSLGIDRVGTEASRPYNGAWPNPNTIPPRQVQTTSFNGQSPDSFDTRSAKLDSSEATGSPRNNNRTAPTSNTAAWPDAPAR